MDSYSVQSTSQKKTIALKALLFEIGVIVCLILGILFLLDYIKVINIRQFYSLQNSANVIVKDEKNETKIGETAPRLSRTQNLYANKSVKSATTTIQYEAIITGIDLMSGSVKGKDNKFHTYNKRINTVSDGTEEMFLFSTSDIPIIKIIKNIDGNEQPMDFTDLKKGDRIKLIMSINELKNVYTDIKIIIYR